MERQAKFHTIVYGEEVPQVGSQFHKEDCLIVCQLEQSGNQVKMLYADGNGKVVELDSSKKGNLDLYKFQKEVEEGGKVLDFNSYLTEGSYAIYINSGSNVKNEPELTSISSCEGLLKVEKIMDSFMKEVGVRLEAYMQTLYLNSGSSSNILIYRRLLQKTTNLENGEVQIGNGYDHSDGNGYSLGKNGWVEDTHELNIYKVLASEFSTPKITEEEIKRIKDNLKIKDNFLEYLLSDEFSPTPEEQKTLKQKLGL
ncbi:hypothetical protein [Ornithobacterium rhinotracheale]|uniref:Uncharacterized protein n=1 Tax=Ornithobacterium rhinotracheale (strain ATCC 51463 / DSM 15997 / CCUG 23171 / CIP 104009 / LMG 9086) TaxID=867902 RepID=I4A078_ORNRL|nr:hypothetical protein [Ornithobacterium rhinotracheale]AFL97362.1 hypothetical protein Ornrh_1177 [Ornithobacterium rhinotracheale DSM 15997]